MPENGCKWGPFGILGSLFQVFGGLCKWSSIKVDSKDISVRAWAGKEIQQNWKKGIYCSINFLCLRPEKETEWSFFSFVQELYLCICKIVKGGVWLVCIVVCHPMDWPGAAQSTKTFFQKEDKITKFRPNTAGQGGHVTLKEGVCECDSLTDFER